MAAINGITGNVTLAGGYVTNVHRWEAELLGESLETTPYQPLGNYRTRIAGLLDWRGSYECYIDDGVALPSPGVVGAAVFTAAAGRTYSGNVLVTSARVGVAVDGSSRSITVSFDGAGQCTPA